MNIQDSLAKNLKFYRKRLRLSQEELAARCDLSRTQVGLIENGKNITIGTLEKLAGGLNVAPPRLLISFEEDGKPQLDYPMRRVFISDRIEGLFDDDDYFFCDGGSDESTAEDDSGEFGEENAAVDGGDTTGNYVNGVANTINGDIDAEDSDRDVNGSGAEQNKIPDSATDLKNCALVYWGDGGLEFQELSVDSAVPSIKVLSILAQTTSSDHELYERYKAVWPEVMRLLKIDPECEWK